MVLPARSAAGAWPREVGTAFLAFSQEVSVTRYGTFMRHSSLYGEYGLRPRLTLGGKIGHSPSGETRALIFARRALELGGDTHKLAWQLGIGALHRPDAPTLPLVQGALHYGRGIDTRFGPGWLGAELRMTQIPGNDTRAFNLDLTMGLSPTERTHLIVQIRGYRDRYNSIVTLAPSFVQRFNSSLKIETGVLVPVTGSNIPGFFTGAWFEF